MNCYYYIYFCLHCMKFKIFLGSISIFKSHLNILIYVYMRTHMTHKV